MSSRSEKQLATAQDSSLGRSDGDVERGDEESVGLDQALAQAQQPFGSSKALWGWLVLNLSTGPTSSMIFTYLPAAIQTVANAVGHMPGSAEPCAAIGPITCLVRFGTREVDYLTYFLYLSSLARGLEAVACILVSGLADYARHRKPMLMGAIYLYGALSLPLAGLVGATYGTLTTLSALYCASTVVMGVWMIIQASYIPIFMGSACGPATAGASSGDNHGPHDGRPGASDARGARASTWGIVINNIGMIASVLVGVIVAYAQAPTPDMGFKSYLLAMTIGGVATIVIAAVGHYLLPSVPGAPRPRGQNIFSLPVQTCWRLARAVSTHPEAFKFCAGWALFDGAWFNFGPLMSSLFLETMGLQMGGGLFSVFTLVGVVAGSLGPLAWMYLFPRLRVPLKSWLYLFLGVNIFCVFWGCLGISGPVAIGFKRPAEFWVFQILFMSTNSALLAYNRVVFATFIPKGSEALFSGLIFLLDLLSGWVLPLVQAEIQNATHNLRYSMLLSLGLMTASVPFFAWVRIEKGVAEAKTAVVL